MSLRFRRSMQLIPGVRLNFSKSTIGLSAGIPGARYTVNSKGRRTLSAGIPGTGLYNVETLSSGTRAKSSTRSKTQQTQELIEIAPPSPGLFSKKAEREFHKFLLDIYHHEDTDTAPQVVEKADELLSRYPQLKHSVELIKFLHAVGDSNFDSVIESWGDAIWQERHAYFNDRIVTKYFGGITPQIMVTPGIYAREKYTIQSFYFIWAEVLQNLEKPDRALAVVNEMEPTQLSAIAMADIEIAMKDYEAAIETTEDIENEDDATAMLLILRGVAFREKAMYDAALECFKRALAKKDRDEMIKHRALFERAETYVRHRKKAMAIKDLEKILVDDSDYRGVVEMLDKLKA